ncbi:hypothetical protein N7513_004303 [Penicillium frequentans]|nr:hypothetical protein N7513_004303 [Penicillium glabrum]
MEVWMAAFASIATIFDPTSFVYFLSSFLFPDPLIRVRRPKAHKVTLMVTSVRLRSFLARPSRLPLVTTRPLIAEIGVRFSDLRKGSRLPISTQGQRHLPVALKPVAQHPSIAKSISQLPSPLVERREARQARSRPWIQPLKQVAPRRTQIQTLPVVAGRKVIPAGVINLERSVAANLAGACPVKSALCIVLLKSGPASVGHAVAADMKNVEMKGPSLTDNSGEAVISLSKKQVSFGDVNVSEVPRWIKPEFVYSPGHDTVSGTLGYRDNESALLLLDKCSEDISGCGFTYFRRLSALNTHINGQCASNGNCSWHWVATHRRYLPDEPPEDSFRLMSNIRRNISGV